MRIVTESPSYVIDAELHIGQNNWDSGEYLAIGQISMEKLFRTVALAPSDSALKFSSSNNQLDIDGMTFSDPLMVGRKVSGEQLLNRRIFNDGLIVIHKGQKIHESYRNGVTAKDRHVIHSCTKSLCSMLVAIAIDECLIEPQKQLSYYLEEFKEHSAWHGVTLQQVLNMQAGIEYSENYADPDAHYWDYARAAGYYPTLDGKPAIGVKAWSHKNLTNRSHAPGSCFVYNSCLANLLGMVLEKVYQDNLASIFESRLFQRCGTESEAFFNTDKQGFPIVEGQFNCRLVDFARCAFLMVNRGKNLGGEQIISPQFIDELVVCDSEARNAYHAQNKDKLFINGQYKNQFWINDPLKKQFCMLGIHGQFAWFDLNREIMMAGVGSYPTQDSELMMRSLNTLWQQVAIEIQH